MKISFVLLIRIQSHHNHDELERLKSIQLKSFRKFLDFSILKDFFIIASNKDLQIIKTDLLQSFPEFPFVFVDEETLYRSQKGDSGWEKQMVLKLAVANILETDYYLTLDTDVFLTKQLSEGDILQNGKLPYQKETPGAHTKWWKSSSRILGMDSGMVLNKDQVMGVTPEYLVTDVCRKLQKEIEGLHHSKDFASWLMSSRMSKKNIFNNIIRVLSERVPAINRLFSIEQMDQISSCNWTEYTLYWAYLIKLQLVDHYYAEDDRQIYGNCIWGQVDINRSNLHLIVEKAFRENKSCHFSIIQSSIKGLDQFYLAELIDNYLN